MKLTVREAAILMGCSERTLRGQLARGELPGEKRHGRWVIDRRHLPLTEAQRRVLQTKAEDLRRAVDDALPSRLGKSRSVADLDAFRLGANLLAEIRTSNSFTAPETAREDIISLLESSLLCVAEAAHQYDRQLKLAALNKARADLARVAGRLLLADGVAPAEPVSTWLVVLESEVLPAVAGFARWADNLGQRRR